MKKIASSAGIALLLLLAVNSFAQPGGGRGAERMVQMYKDSLNLSQVQADSVKAIMEYFQPQQREIFMNQDMDRESKMSAIMELNKQRNERLNKVLTADQMKRLKEIEERRRQQMMQGGGGRPGGGPGSNRSNE